MTKEMMTVPAEAVKAQKERMSNFFRLYEGFNTEIAPKSVKVTTAIEDGKSVTTGYRIKASTDRGLRLISGYALENAFVIDTDKLKDLQKVNDKAGCYWIDDVEAIAPVRFGDSIDADSDFMLPEKLQVLGAAIFKSQLGDYPQVGLYRYPGYKLLVAHHRKIMNDAKARLTAADAVYYAGLTGKDRPAGLTARFKFDVDAKVKEDMSNWNFRLILAPISE